MRPSITLHRTLFLALAVVFTLIVSACGSAAQTGAPTAAPVNPPATEPPAAVPTDLPTSTPTAEPTPMPTAEPTATATAAPTETSAPTEIPTPTPDPALEAVKLAGLAWMPHYNMLLSFDFPGPVDPADYRVTLEGKEYECEVLAQYPNRLYCHGPGAKVLTTAVIRVYPAGSEQPGYEKSYWIPYFE